jgi:hypothetical protein
MREDFRTSLPQKLVLLLLSVEYLAYPLQCQPWSRYLKYLSIIFEVPYQLREALRSPEGVLAGCMADMGTPLCT